MTERHTRKANDDLRESAQSLLRTVLKKNDEEDGRKVGLAMYWLINRYQ